MQAAGEICMAVFLPSLVIGNFMVFNLFLALLLNSFASDSIRRNKDTKEESKMKQGWQRLKGLFKAKGAAVDPAQADKKPSLANIILELKRQKELREKLENGEEDIEKAEHQGETDEKKTTLIATENEKENKKSLNNLNNRLNADGFFSI
jgi:hypothetical protein